MGVSWVKTRYPHPGECVIKPVQLELGIGGLLQIVRDAQVGEYPPNYQMFFREQPPDGAVILWGDAEAVHTGVQSQVDPDWAALGGQGVAVGLVRYGLGQPPAPQERDRLRRCVAQN